MDKEELNHQHKQYNQHKAQFTHTCRRHDTTVCDTTRFSLPILSNGSVHTYAARPSLVVTTKSCYNKNRSGSDFCHMSQRHYQKAVSTGISPGLINL